MYARDLDSKALLPGSREGLEAYKLQRDRAKKLDRLESDINTLKADVSAIRELLTSILTTGRN